MDCTTEITLCQAKTAESCLGHGQMQELGLPGRLEELEARDGDGQVEALWTGAAGVDI